MSNTITIELCQEDRQRLDELISFAGLIVSELNSRRPLQLQSIDEHGIRFGIVAEEHPVDAVAPHGEPEPVAESAEEPEEPKFTHADVQAKTRQLVRPDHPKRLEAKAIIKSYADKVSNIPEDKLTEVMKKLTALEG